MAFVRFKFFCGGKTQIFGAGAPTPVAVCLLQGVPAVSQTTKSDLYAWRVTAAAAAVGLASITLAAWRLMRRDMPKTNSDERTAEEEKPNQAAINHGPLIFICWTLAPYPSVIFLRHSKTRLGMT